MPGNSLLLALCALLALLAAALGLMWWRARGSGHTAAPRITAADAAALFALRAEPTQALHGREAAGLAALRDGLPGHLVSARVPLARFLRVAPAEQAAWSSLVGALEIDLLVCDAQGHPLLAVDVAAQDSSAAAQKLRKQGLRVIESAGLAVYRWSREEASERLVAGVGELLRSAAATANRPRAAPLATSATSSVTSPASAGSSAKAAGSLSGAIPVAEAVELSADELPEFAPTTIFRPDDTLPPPRS